jgi:hypothetical protein
MDERLDIFISYASVDRPKAQQLAAALERQGWSVWWDREILPGDKFSQIIEEKLRAAKCMLVLWSKTSVASDWVQIETVEGNTRGILVPILIDDTDPARIPLEFRRLEAAQLATWEGSSTHEEFTLLLRAIRRRLNEPGPRDQRASDGRVLENQAYRVREGGQAARRRESGDERETRPWWRTGYFLLAVAAALSMAFVLFVGRLQIEAPQPTDLPSHGEPVPASPAPALTMEPVESSPEPPRLPFFMTRLVTDEDLEGKSKWELDVMRNEIYARHGRRFKRTDLQQYFDREPWYAPRTDPGDRFPTELLSDVQVKNVEFIRNYQHRRGWS